MSSTLKTIGLFGGTFDPIHLGHLRMALELKQQLHLDEMRLVPCHKPPHRHQPVASATDRAAMVELAIQSCPELTIETCELQHAEPSYSVNTLKHLRSELGENISLCLAMGMDSLISLPSWYEWQEILKLAHIVVAARPGYTLPSEGDLADYIAKHSRDAENLKTQSRGAIVIQQLSLLPISSTQIRSQIQQGESPQFLLPDAVFNFLQQHALYSSEN